jgi:peptidyl-tRNA hydrolase
LSVIVLGISIVFSLGFADNHKNYELKTETYIVQHGDILDEITDKYMLKNTYGKRGHDEFKQGIKELNMDKYPYIRYGEIKAGDRLRIIYWIRKEVKNNE